MDCIKIANRIYSLLCLPGGMLQHDVFWSVCAREHLARADARHGGAADGEEGALQDGNLHWECHWRLKYRHARRSVLWLREIVSMRLY